MTKSAKIDDDQGASSTAMGKQVSFNPMVGQTEWSGPLLERSSCISEMGFAGCCCPCLAAEDIAWKSKAPDLWDTKYCQVTCCVISAGAVVAFIVDGVVRGLLGIESGLITLGSICATLVHRLFITGAMMWWKNDLGKRLNIRTPEDGGSCRLPHITKNEFCTYFWCACCYMNHLEMTVECNNIAHGKRMTKKKGKKLSAHQRTLLARQSLRVHSERASVLMGQGASDDQLAQFRLAANIVDSSMSSGPPVTLLEEEEKSMVGAPVQAKE